MIFDRPAADRAFPRAIFGQPVHLLQPACTISSFVSLSGLDNPKTDRDGVGDVEQVVRALEQIVGG